MSLLHGDQGLDEMEQESRRDREISLGMSTMLGIFFALTLVCAGFFGFGYTLGRKSAAATAAATADSASGDDSFRTFKPSPGAPAIQAAPGFSGTEAAAANAAAVNTTYAPPATGTAKPAAVNAAGNKPSVAPAAGSLVMTAPVARPKPVDPDAIAVGDDAPAKPAPASVAAKPAPAASGGTMVQVSAFTRQEDADVVVSALKRKGYNVFIRREPQDSFLHVQLGPYGSRKEADAMREKLSSDGFNAMVK